MCVLFLLSANALGRSSKNEKEIHFDLYHQYLVVLRGSLGKLGKRNILLDTGTNPITIDQRVAQQLGLKELPDARREMHAMSGQVEARLVNLSSLEIGPIHREGIPAAVWDLSMFQRQAGVRIDAVIGLGVFAPESFKIDYASRRIVFGPIEAGTPSVPFASGPPFVTVPMQVRSQPLKVLIDTGAAGLILFKNRMGEWQRDLPVVSRRESNNVIGAASLLEVKVDGMQMGKENFEAGSAFLVESHCCNFDGLFGVSGDRVKEIGFDFDRGLFSWRLQDGPLFPAAESQSPDCIFQPSSAEVAPPRGEEFGPLPKEFGPLPGETTCEPKPRPLGHAR